jgi:UDP-N-acetylmuramate--alanine ligase
MSKICGVKRIHLIGAGGISMSALAKLMLMQGKKVTGSDIVFSKELETLIEWGVDIWVGHEPEKLRDTDLVIYSAAVPEDDPELVYARENGIPTVARQHFLGEIAKDYDKVIAVSGTHGKTTATAMIANVFLVSEEAFTAHIGGNLYGKGNMLFKGFDWLVTEACEYKKSLFSLDPDIAVILNVEPDHPDTYATEEELNETFAKFLERATVKGHAVINADCHFYHMLKRPYSNMLTFGIGDRADVRAENIAEYQNGYFEFQITHKKEPIISIRMNIPGYHNVYNALAAYCAGTLAGLSADKIKEGIESFRGVERRFENKGKLHGADIVIDYAHHPTEIRAAIATARCLRPKRLIAVFQPHTFSRTKQLYNDFLKAFTGADKVYIFKEYAARETADKGMDAGELYKGLRNAHVRCAYFSDMIALAKSLSAEVGEGDVVLILGAGDIALMGDLLVR